MKFFSLLVVVEFLVEKIGKQKEKPSGLSNFVPILGVKISLQN
jgi:hypothetical protein